MKITTFVKRLLTSPKRSQIKRNALKEILTSPQFNNDPVTIHRMDTNNVGDYYCAPHHYFEKLGKKALDIFDYKSTDENVVTNWTEKISESKLIIGGGGLLNRRSFEKQMKVFEVLSNKNKKSVLWGIGHNSKNQKHFGNISSYNVNTDNFGLVGTRDYDIAQNWVPCVSCLHPIFDEKFTPTQEVGVIFHKNTMKNKEITSKFRGFPSTSNTTDMRKLIEFIGSSDTIITDSYHTMYWSILMERKVVVVPNSSKFFSFKYDPVFSSFENSLQDINKTERYSGVLEECREINLKFAERVFNYLEIQ